MTHHADEPTAFIGDWSPHPHLISGPFTQMPKPAGLSFNRYAAIAGRILRKALKEDKRVVAERLDSFELKRVKWEGGRQGEAETLNVPLKN